MLARRKSDMQVNFGRFVNRPYKVKAISASTVPYGRIAQRICPVLFTEQTLNFLHIVSDYVVVGFSFDDYLCFAAADHYNGGLGNTVIVGGH